MDREEVIISGYRKIAIDIADNIATGKYKEGEKLYGRSVLASHYRVSPETIRRALYMLKDVGIVSILKGSGSTVVSQYKAQEFLKLNKDVKELRTVKKELEAWAKSQVKQSGEILKKIKFLIDETDRIKVISPLNPFQLTISQDCKVLGKTISEMQFWHNTGATVIAIKNAESLLISPGPYASLSVGDSLYFVGDEAAYSAVMELLYK